ncbi:hypothetical protein C7B61_07765 [filamentous cyanobacterium CCP1]|nr:hypothetical protein C7B76_21500 [filamentous cyanobacterium CCP2]PSB67136.1 hypothetical protein C7B61_07765 [filamentous cyanobacterium CCP1]
MVKQLAGKCWAWFKWLVRPSGESIDYLIWRHQFLIKRSRLYMWISLPLFLTAVLLLVVFVHHYPEPPTFPEQSPFSPEMIEEWQTYSRRIVQVHWVAMGFLSLCPVLQRTRWSRRFPALLFLAISWSMTLVPQIVFLGWSAIARPAWEYVFFMQAVLVPVHWRLHLLSQVISIGFYFCAGLFLILTGIEPGNFDETLTVASVGLDIFNIFWTCLICCLAVALYERLQRSEFESRKHLQMFLHAVTHDLQNPLIGTSIVLQNLLRRDRDADHNVMVSAPKLEQLLAGNARQLQLVQSLLEIHCNETQDLILQREPLPLALLVEDVVSDLEEFLKEHQATITNHISDNLPAVDADRTQLARVFSNLISNAVKHNPGKIHLVLNADVICTASRKGLKLKPGRSNQNKPNHPAIAEKWMVRCSVQDNGSGIPPEQCRHLFELYWRNPQTRHSPGLGMGLYLCRQIIAAHGGQIHVSSEVGMGSTFWFTVPLVAHTSPDRKATTAA